MNDASQPQSIRQVLETQNEQLKAQLMATSLINEITKVMLASPELESVFRTIVLGIQETLGFERVILFDVDRDNFSLKPKIWAGVEDQQVKKVSIPLGFMGGGTADAVFLNKHIIVDVVDPDVDPVATLSTKAYLVIPLVAKATRKCWEYHECDHQECPAYENFNPCCWSIFGSCLRHETTTEDERRQACLNCDMFKCVGVLWMDKPNADQLVSSDQMTTLTTLAYQAGIIIDNFEMYRALEGANANLKDINERLGQLNEDLRKAHSKINKDLDHARVIQTGLLPTEFSDTQNLKVGARYIPASQVGGDYYDLFKINDHTFGVVVADVSGHGVAAAMVMAMTKVLLKTFCQQILSPRETLERINTIFQTDIKTDNFVTVFYAVVDTQAKQMRYVSAGHNPVIFMDRETTQYDIIKADGLFLGVFEDMMLTGGERPYKSGDRLVLYTDGLTEAENKTNEMYTFERLCDVSQNLAGKEPGEFVDLVLENLYEFTQGKTFEDDVTMLVVDF